MTVKLKAPVRKRLEKLATYLEGLPEDYSHFAMRSFVRNRKSDDLIARYARKNGGVDTCGTAACAVGHGPSAGIIVPEKYINIDTFDVVDWFGYSLLFTGEAEANTPLWEWMFGASWSRLDADNHHYGAAARIRFILDGNDVPAGVRSFSDMGDFVPIYRAYDKRFAAETANA